MPILATILFATAVAPGVALIAGGFSPGQQPDGNSIVFSAPQGLVVVDTGRHVEHTQKILDFAASVHQPIAAVINTHWHLDHIGGNPRIRAAFPNVKIFATSALEEARTGFLAHYRKQLVEMIEKSKDPEEQKTFSAEVAIIDAGGALAPDEVIAGDGKRSIAGRDFDIHVEHGATKGDIWLFDRKSKTLVAGDLVTFPVPFLDTACTAAWKTALDHLAATKFSTLVPGHGEPMDREQFEVYRTAFSNLLACAGSSRPREECVAGWLTPVAHFNEGVDPKFVRGMMGYYVDVLRKPAASAGCP